MLAIVEGNLQLLFRLDVEQSIAAILEVSEADRDHEGSVELDIGVVSTSNIGEGVG